MQTAEINGFLIDKFNQHDLKEGASQGTCPLCSSTRKPEIEKPNVLAMTGNVVSVPVTTVTLVFNFILTNARAQARGSMLDQLSPPTLTR